VKLFKLDSTLAQINHAQAATIFVAAVVLLGLAYYAFSGAESSGQATSGTAAQAGLQLPRAPSLMGAGGHDMDAAADTALTNAAELPKPNSLANTQADGDWSIGPNGQPQPSMALRRRFDYFLLLQGEVDLSAVAAQIRKQVQAAHGAAAAQQIMALWDSYLRLQQYTWTTHVNMQRRETWAPALAERSAIRRQLLGTAWAEAFYADEENALRQMIAQANSGLPVTSATQAADPIALPDAAQRIAAHEAQWQQWEQRLAAARSRVEQLRNAPELSDPQRSEAITTYVNQQFSGSELLRAKALLNL
jgi:lipase chaperone LimK